MAEYCLECLNRIHGTDFRKNEVVLLEDLCEGCGEIKLCVVSLRSPSGLERILTAIKKAWVVMSTRNKK